MNKLRLILAIRHLKLQGKLGKFEEKIVTDDSYQFIVSTTGFIGKMSELSERVRFLDELLMIIEQRIPDLKMLKDSPGDIPGLNEEYYEYAYTKYENAKTFIKQRLEMIYDKMPLSQWFRDYKGIEIFNNLLNYFNLLDNGMLKNKKIPEVTGIFKAVCERGLTKRDYFAKMNDRELGILISDLCAKFIEQGHRQITTSTVSKALGNEKHLKTYNEALEKIDDLTPE